MKKFIKCVLSVALVFVIAFSVTGCKKKISSTTTDTDKVMSVDGKSTNGGTTVVYDGYLYFINGTKTNDGTNAKDNVRGAVYRVSYDEETGVVSVRLAASMKLLLKI